MLYAIIYVLACFTPCLCARLIHVDVYVSMPTYLDLCFHMPMCLDLFSLHAIFYLPCAYALHAMFVCLDLSYVCHAMCYSSPFIPFIAFSCILAYWVGSDLDPMVFVIIHTPWPISKVLIILFACLFLLAYILYALC